MKQGDQIEQEYTHDFSASNTIMTGFQDGKSDGPGGSNHGKVSSKFKQVKQNMNEVRNRSKSPKDYQRKSPNNREPFLKSTSPTGNMATLG